VKWTIESEITAEETDSEVESDLYSYSSLTKAEHCDC